jgi:lipid A ethanolaminephosphotransferase
MWMSADYERNFKIDRQCLNNMAEKDEVSQDNLFHTLIGMMNVQTREYQSQLDILQRCRSGS